MAQLRRSIPVLALAGFAAAVAAQPEPTYTPSAPPSSQPLPPWQPGRKIEPGSEDAAPLKIQRLEPRIDLRVPTGFDGVYQINKADIFGRPQIPGAPGDSLYMRMDGGLMAVFPRSVYRETSRGGLVPQIPPGTVFYLGGLPSGLVGAGKVQDSQGKAGPTAPMRTPPDAASPTDPDAVPFALSGIGVPQDSARFLRPGTITIWKDETYRRRRLDTLLSRLAEGASPDPTPNVTQK